MTDSHTLLASYARTGSESAFRELVSRYIDLVYSTAFRLVGGDAQSAQDVAQTVFVALADKAGTLPKDVMLGGWLHQHTRFVAGKLMRTERRRQLRERQAAEMNAIEDHSESNLAQVAPVLDEAIGQLDAEDRTAILLRFFERKDFRSVGEALGSSEDAARKRVDRALEKLHVLLKHRGATLSAAALGTALATEAVTAAPAGLAARHNRRRTFWNNRHHHSSHCRHQNHCYDHIPKSVCHRHHRAPRQHRALRSASELPIARSSESPPATTSATGRTNPAVTARARCGDQPVGIVDRG